MHLLEPDKHSVAVAHHLLQAPGTSSWGYRAVLCRRFLGDPLSDALHLPVSGSICSWEWATSTVEMWVLRLYTTLGRCPPTRWLLYWMHSHGMTIFHGHWSMAPRPKRAGAAASQVTDPKTRGGCPFECVLIITAFSLCLHCRTQWHAGAYLITMVGVWWLVQAGRSAARGVR